MSDAGMWCGACGNEPVMNCGDLCARCAYVSRSRVEELERGTERLRAALTEWLEADNELWWMRATVSEAADENLLGPHRRLVAARKAARAALAGKEGE